MDTSAVILAGGESRRMGRDKAWLEIDGKPLIQLALEKVRALGISELFISGRLGEDYSVLDCPVLFDLEPGFGPIGGIERGLHECNSRLLLVLAVDLPRMNSEFLRRLLKSCDRLTGIVPRLNDRIEPLAAIYPKRCRVLASSAITRAQYSARDFVSACLQERAVRAFPVSHGDANLFVNWNSPSDVVSVA